MPMLKSPVYRLYARSLVVGLFVALGTYALGWLPHGDLLQAIWVLISATVTATLVLRRRLREDDDTRYTRVASKHFRHWIRVAPDLVQGLFAANVPRSVLEFFEKETGCRLSECDDHHVVDSWARKDDPPGALVFRAGLELGRMVEAARAEGTELGEFLSSRFRTIVTDGRELLGHEVAPGVFVRQIASGEFRPAGVHICHPESRVLGVVERFEYGSNAVTTVSVGLKREDYAHLSPEGWNELRETLFGFFPYLRPSAGGSGPQKQRVPLFLAEQPLTDETVAEFERTLARAHATLVERFGATPSPPRPEASAAVDGDDNAG